MTPLTRQDIQRDVQILIEQARVKLHDHVAAKQDVQVLQDAIKALTATLQQNQQLLRQSDNQYTQMVRRAAALETRMVQMEHELQQLQRIIGQLVDQPPTEKITERVVVTSADDHKRYVYTPT